MEPKLPTPSPSREMAGYPRQELPLAPEMPTASTDKQPERGRSAEAVPTGPSNSGPMLPLPQIPIGGSSQIAGVKPAVPAATDDNPLVAADDEVIEKEWVDKAKKIVDQTKDDPYRQEKEVSKLQADYLKKRYGKDIKIPNE